MMLETEEKQDRLKGGPYQRIRSALPPPPLPLRRMQRLARHCAPGAAHRAGAVSDVRAGAQNGKRRAGGQLRHPDCMERRPWQRHLLLRTLAQNISRVLIMSFSDNLENSLK